MGDSDLGGDGCCGLQGGREGGRDGRLVATAAAGEGVLGFS
jgi:hypothetical protein